MARNRKRANGKRPARQSRAGLRGHPPQIRANLEMSHKYRFTSTSGTARDITDTLLLTAAGVMATSATVGASLYQAVRLKRVSIWSPPASQGAAVTCSIFWPGNSGGTQVGGRDTEVSDTTVSVAEPAYVTSAPPTGSLASFWNNGNASRFCTLVCPPGSIIDIELQLVLGDGVIAPTAAAAVLVGATAGVVYYCGLDSATKASASYLPVSLTSI